MKKITALSFLTLILFCFYSCNSLKTNKYDSDLKIKETIPFASNQYQLMLNKIEEDDKIKLPNTFVEGNMKYVSPTGWTSGFFPGSLWYLYELTGDKGWMDHAIKYTNSLEDIQYFTNHHDVGFMIGCSYGNGYRLTNNEDYKKVMVQTAKSLITRYNPATGLILSWNADPKRDWEYPVIIDNLMNLEILFDATEFTGDSTFYNIAVTHADNTMKNHYRPDYSTWHVVDYNPKDGSIRHKVTSQGYADESCWARGQAWGIYGYVMCYRKTGDEKYLRQAENALEFVADHPDYPEDGVPYWDFNDPKIPDTYRDASAGAIMASALYEISDYSDRRDYMRWADKIIETLLTPDYLAELNTNGHFLLKHSVGNLPHNGEIDVPLVYTDYYFLEALKRKRDIEN